MDCDAPDTTMMWDYDHYDEDSTKIVTQMKAFRQVTLHCPQVQRCFVIYRRIPEKKIAVSLGKCFSRIEITRIHTN